MGKGVRVMLDVRLTKESRHVLKSIYEIYCERRKGGQSKAAAVQFSSQESGGPEIAGFDDAGSELAKAKLIRMDIIGNYTLTDDAIFFMENFTKDTILKWLEFGANFIP